MGEKLGAEGFDLGVYDEESEKSRRASVDAARLSGGSSEGGNTAESQVASQEEAAGHLEQRTGRTTDWLNDPARTQDT